MSKKSQKALVILESPTKTKAVQKYLGDGYNVMSSEGHVNNLSKKGPLRLGIDLETFTPLYSIPRKKSPLVTKIKNAASKVDRVYLATDPDREGEAIAFHLQNIIQSKLGNEKKVNFSRVTFNEITKSAVKEAFNHPHEIDYNLVKSQETRRMLDRIIGFRLSRLLQMKINARSAGRVQSVALKLIVERQELIDNFVPDEYWTITAVINKKFEFELVAYKKQKLALKNKSEVDNVLSSLTKNPIVSKIEKKQKTKNPPLPLTTSLLFQQASSQLNFSSSKTAFLAQTLYEGIKINGSITGLVTYIRTDSYRLSDKFISDAEQWIIERFGKNYVFTNFKSQKKLSKKQNVQDAHEAIRPTNLSLTPDKAQKFLKKDEYKLYTLIYNRTLKALMSPAKLETLTVSLDDNGYEFRNSHQSVIFDGFLALDPKNSKNSENLTSFVQDQNLKVDKIIDEQHFTKPKPQYTEARLIQTLEELGIGRPSTYATIIKTLKDRNYVNLIKKSFSPTDSGKLANKMLQEFFNKIINETYTSNVEANLDKIASGKADNIKIIRDFWNVFEPQVDYAFEKMPTIPKTPPKEVGRDCPKCGNKLVYRNGRYGLFIGCSTFPKCRYIESIVIKLGPCPNCKDGTLEVKRSKNGRKFVGCSNFPNCKFTSTEEKLAKNNSEQKENSTKV